MTEAAGHSRLPAQRTNLPSGTQLVGERLFPRHKGSARAARDFAVGTLAYWGYADRLDDVRLCVSEIAANAVVHGVPPGRKFAVRLVAYHGCVRIEVRDSGNGCPSPMAPDVDAVAGRGLLLVSELADAWGVTEHAVGKTVWLTFESAEEE